MAIICNLLEFYQMLDTKKTLSRLYLINKHLFCYHPMFSGFNENYGSLKFGVFIDHYLL